MTNTLQPPSTPTTGIGRPPVFAAMDVRAKDTRHILDPKSTIRDVTFTIPDLGEKSSDLSHARRLFDAIYDARGINESPEVVFASLNSAAKVVRRDGVWPQSRLMDGPEGNHDIPFGRYRIRFYFPSSPDAKEFFLTTANNNKPVSSVPNAWLAAAPIAAALAEAGVNLLELDGKPHSLWVAPTETAKGEIMHTLYVGPGGLKGSTDNRNLRDLPYVIPAVFRRIERHGKPKSIIS